MYLQKNRLLIFETDGLDVEDITFYDDYIEVEFDNPDYHHNSNVEDRLDSITKRLGGSEYVSYNNTVKIYF